MKNKLAPILVAWVLFDTTTDEKYIKMNPADGSLAIFDTEEAAMAAKKLHYGTDYKRCEYYSAPQPAPEVAKLVEALESLMEYVPYDVVQCRGDKCRELWCASCFGEEDAETHITTAAKHLKNAKSALAAHRQQGGEL